MLQKPYGINAAQIAVVVYACSSYLDQFRSFSIYIYVTFNHSAQAIEKVKTDKADKPYQDVKILNVTVPKT